ncbi:hypothetical protein [Cyanobacterium sp. Dongsha4]|uniref:hypothetical protein n=1 Tax=Cyanobacterium sp. DS4 TaxID=2878255 RepID=UPI002E7FF450|nr:hypothetical protein [Cyanobacterium sp. Dongsha4]WVL01918.1 hypothetical protein Dongsha4_06950 [Cyanobacterium sp. Dongsha4]
MNNNFFDPDQNSGNVNDFSADNEVEKISPQKKKEIQKLFMILLAIGLVIGIFTAWGVVTIMNNFGLTEKTNQFEKLHGN